ncbi:MAG: RICIN domain-containing protein [Acidobacteria bacterium]|nr:RICIN domain-containing protein [Acidobacteriota bacterium]
MKALTLTLCMGALFAQGGFRGAGRYEITSVLSRKVIDMDRNDQRTILQFDSRRTDNQMWDIVDAGGGAFFIRNAMNGNALSVQDNRNSTPLVADPYDGSPRQRWRIEGGDRDTAILVNDNGKAIDIPYGSTNNGVKLNSYNRNNEVNQRWVFAEVRGGGNRPNRYDPTGVPSRRGDRYDSPQQGSFNNNRPDRDGMYFDDRERVYKLDGNGVCFYRDRDFQGDAVCARMGADRSRIGARFSQAGSVRFFGNARGVQLFDREDYRGNAIEFTRDERDLRNYRGVPQSMRVY